MPTSFLTSVKQLLLFILHLFFTVVFGFMAWASWGLYHDEVSSNQYQQEGELKTVTVTDLNTEKRQWKDYLGNVEYISFIYQGKPYIARYPANPSFVSRGMQVTMLYDARLDAFRQPVKPVAVAATTRSRLLNWTSASLFSPKRLALMTCGIISVVFFFLLTGLLARIPGLAFLRMINGFVFTLFLLAGVLFLTYNAMVYYRYYHHIKASGERIEMVVLDKDRYQLTRSTGTDNFPLYGYSAQVQFRNAERTIPISKQDYEVLHKGSPLEIYYDASADDMMATDYAINFWLFLFTGVVWILFLYAAGRWIGGMRNKGRIH